jgi:phosphonatase-like hydrolase
MSIRLAVFDLAGTTVSDNKYVHHVLQTALANAGVEISIDDANEVMGIPKPVAIRSLLRKRYHGDRPIYDEWIKSIHEDFVSRMIHFYRHDAEVKEREGVSEVFEKLRQSKLKVVVDTGFDRQITDPLLERLGWKKNNLIDESVTSDEVPRGRPFPDMIFKAMVLTGVSNPADVAKIGDTPSDLQEGMSAGCRIVAGVTTGAFTRQQLLLERHTHLIETVQEIPGILNIKN